MGVDEECTIKAPVGYRSNVVLSAAIAVSMSAACAACFRASETKHEHASGPEDGPPDGPAQDSKAHASSSLDDSANVDLDADGPPARRLPNVIFILADDMGYTEVGAYGQQIIKTPHIDQMVAEGMRFTQHYAGQTVCAPSRCSLLTGKHQGHATVRNNLTVAPYPDILTQIRTDTFPGQFPLAADDVTIAELLKARGYATAAMGKWGLGKEGSTGDPLRHGFDLFYGYLDQGHAHNHYPRFLWSNGVKEFLPGNDGESVSGQTYSQDKFTDSALSFIRQNQDRPFFLYLPFIIPHVSIQVPDSSLNQYRGILPETDYTWIDSDYVKPPFPHAGYAAMISHMDRSIGTILALVKRLGLDDDTIVFFASDNGPVYDRIGGSDSYFFKSAAPFKGLKGSLYEGGIRVPLIVRWPGHVQRASVSEHISAFWDTFATIADLTETKAASTTDGISYAPTLRGQGPQATHDYLYWEFMDYGGQQAVRMGTWKAIRQDMSGSSSKANLKTELYDLSQDPGETQDVAREHADIVGRAVKFMSESHTPNRMFPLYPID